MNLSAVHKENQLHAPYAVKYARLGDRFARFCKVVCIFLFFFIEIIFFVWVCPHTNFCRFVLFHTVTISWTSILFLVFIFFFQKIKLGNIYNVFGCWSEETIKCDHTPALFQATVNPGLSDEHCGPQLPCCSARKNVLREFGKCDAFDGARTNWSMRCN